MSKPIKVYSYSYTIKNRTAVIRLAIDSDAPENRFYTLRMCERQAQLTGANRVTYTVT